MGKLCMSKIIVKPVLYIFLGFYLAVFSAAQDNPSGGGEMGRSSIPDALRWPQRGEAPRYPVDTVIGPLGRGEVSEEAYLFARKVSAALTAGNRGDPNLSAMNSVSLEAFISELNGISPRSYRLGSGREEPDGAFSFLVRFLGRERGITGELYIRPQEQKPAEEPRPPETAEALELSGQAEEAEPAAVEDVVLDEETAQAETAPPVEAPVVSGPVVWLFEDLILEEAQERNGNVEEDTEVFDFPPYERFF
jgi:hypothetical protein